jgi:formylglycine-generating enzyme required for sulfatase activity
MNIAPVGTATLGVALWGQLDMSGEVQEWNLDWWAPYFDAVSAPYVACTDCAYLTGSSSSRMYRGGSFDLSVWNSASRGANTPVDRAGANGVRCARTP